LFHGRRFEREDVRLLDFPGAEFIMIGARTDPEQAYGVELKTEKEDYAHAEIIRELPNGQIPPSGSALV